MALQYQGYCITCQKELCEPMANGEWVERITNDHVERNPDHETICGYIHPPKN